MNIEEAKNSFIKTYFKDPINSVGIGIGPIIDVCLSREPDEEFNIPSEWEGFPVKFTIGGPIATKPEDIAKALGAELIQPQKIIWINGRPTTRCPDCDKPTCYGYHKSQTGEECREYKNRNNPKSS